ncbi:MAG TPA: hypothetical protein VFU05_17540 [Cyclobacteriaceae bacterium]|nr:hypothetical protein [Cyclobacteriaceae bacterium]
MEPKQTAGNSAFVKAWAAPGISLTFSPKVTRDQLIANLDKILGELGCQACGLNGIDFIRLRADRFPEISRIKQLATLSKTDVLQQVDIEQPIFERF